MAFQNFNKITKVSLLLFTVFVVMILAEFLNYITINAIPALEVSFRLLPLTIAILSAMARGKSTDPYERKINMYLIVLGVLVTIVVGQAYYFNENFHW